ncbi:UxaA family hydrolase [Novosphingobium sp. KACC 22771]|uniref:UxaA family hydrolase n=1 Tax=Novosphingobium sp. KACC 22771 TaxID=3025670 RepID=UPI0023667963|nr:altronate dehydratase family protein [Novosphingobium sp. KACC 22771]WDF74131.1 altronate dehydratase family protein [Novosphingobium sp. KACC 22771]
MMSLQPALIRVHSEDTVAVALRPIAAGEQVALGAEHFTAAVAIPQGHKLALTTHAPGDTVRKYGQPIGRATAAIARGDHVHTHNLATALAGELTYAPGSHGEVAPTQVNTTHWRGYLRSDGRAATRNEIWVLPTVGCVGLTAEQIAREATVRHANLIAAGRIDGIHAFSHPHGCSQLGDDLAGTRAVLAGLAANPNAAGVLVLGLGCESNQIDELLTLVPENARGKLATLSSQSAGDELAEAAALIDTMVARAATAERVDLPLSALVVGLKCGGSDGFSGLTANPLLGRFAETLAGAGGTPVLTEIPEIFGAEQALLSRSINAQVFDAAAGLINRFKRYYLDQGLPVSENPSPGNLAGGITTLEEKSLGAVQKAGHVALCSVIDYGQSAKPGGLVLLEAPGNDAISSTALAAAGATMVLFTTGRGTPLGFPVPTVKVASNHQLAANKPHWIDFDAAMALDDGQRATDAAFLARLVAIASGEKTAAERHGQRAIAIWRRGVTL